MAHDRRTGARRKLAAARLIDRLQDRGEQFLRGRTGAIRIWTRTLGNAETECLPELQEHKTAAAD
jgi:hypothetical protein